MLSLFAFGSRAGRRRPSLLPLFCSLLCLLECAQAQLINGQFFTDGLSIINAPAANGAQNSGGTLAISVDVSGNGKLQLVPDSRFSSLFIYLISPSVGVNVTITDSPDFLNGEPGSTVKHLSWPIPSCLPAADDYAVTFYETARFQGDNFYTITPIPIKLNSQAPAGSSASFACISPPPTRPSSLPQADARLPFAPFVPSSTYTRPASTSSSPPSAPSSSSSTGGGGGGGGGGGSVTEITTTLTLTGANGSPTTSTVTLTLPASAPGSSSSTSQPTVTFISTITSPDDAQPTRPGVPPPPPPPTQSTPAAQPGFIVPVSAAVPESLANMPPMVLLLVVFVFAT